MYALTIRQPWAWAILHLGKNIENRTWKPPESLIGQRIAIHAGKQIDRLASGDCLVKFAGSWWIDPAEFDLSAIVGTALLEGVVKESNNPWFEGPYGWLLKDVKALKRPIHCRGWLGLWRTPDEISEEIKEQE